LDKEEAESRAKKAEQQTNAGYRESSYYGWTGSGDGTRGRDEMRALEVLELDNDADFDAIKKAWRTKAKEVHPDVRPNDGEAAKAFRKLQLAYEVLRAAEDQRQWRAAI
jgi:DnaJ-class molecular chaperone